MKAWQKGAIIVVLVLGLLLIPLFNPSIVPMRFHANADYTKERFMESIREAMI